MEKYYEYLDQRSALNKINHRHGVDLYLEPLIDHIATITKSGEMLTVGDLLRESQFGSQATIHARLGLLVEKCLIDRKTISEDSRAKSLTLGKEGKARAKAIHRLMSV